MLSDGFQTPKNRIQTSISYIFSNFGANNILKSYNLCD